MSEFFTVNKLYESPTQPFQSTGKNTEKNKKRRERVKQQKAMKKNHQNNISLDSLLDSETVSTKKEDALSEMQMATENDVPSESSGVQSSTSPSTQEEQPASFITVPEDFDNAPNSSTVQDPLEEDIKSYLNYSKKNKKNNVHTKQVPASSPTATSTKEIEEEKRIVNEYGKKI